MACPERTYEIVKSSSSLSPQATNWLTAWWITQFEFTNVQGEGAQHKGVQLFQLLYGSEGIHEILTSNANEASDILWSILLVTNKPLKPNLPPLPHWCPSYSKADLLPSIQSWVELSRETVDWVIDTFVNCLHLTRAVFEYSTMHVLLYSIDWGRLINKG